MVCTPSKSFGPYKPPCGPNSEARGSQRHEESLLASQCGFLQNDSGVRLSRRACLGAVTLETRTG